MSLELVLWLIRSKINFPVLKYKAFILVLICASIHVNRQEFKTSSGLQKISTGEIWFEYNNHDIDTFQTIVFEAGAMSYSNYWNPVFDSITKFANTIRYDRAGLGRSGPSKDSTRTAVQIAHELNELLDSLHVIHPIVLVCHSIGGFYGRALTYLFEKRVKMLILIESHCTEWEELIRLSLTEKQNMERDSIIKLNRLRMSFFELQEYKAVKINQSFLRNLPQMEVPVYIISGSSHHWPDGYKSDLLCKNWENCQKNLLNISSNSCLTLIPNAGHHVFQDFSLYKFLCEKIGSLKYK